MTERDYINYREDLKYEIFKLTEQLNFKKLELIELEELYEPMMKKKSNQIWGVKIIS